MLLLANRRRSATAAKFGKGFTLIELLGVIAIIGLLASIVLASLNTARKKSRDARRIADVKQLQLALELYFDANSGSYLVGTDMSGLAPAYIPAIPVAPSPGSYSYQGIDSGNGTCTGTETCTSYVLRAQLEENLPGGPLSSDVDGTVTGVDCADGTNRYYCVRP